MKITRKDQKRTKKRKELKSGEIFAYHDASDHLLMAITVEGSLRSFSLRDNTVLRPIESDLSLEVMVFPNVELVVHL